VKQLIGGACPALRNGPAFALAKVFTFQGVHALKQVLSNKPVIIKAFETLSPT
jgi:hypothetical protein